MDLVHLPGVEPPLLHRMRDKMADAWRPKDTTETDPAGVTPADTSPVDAVPASNDAPAAPRMAPNPAQGSSAHAAVPAPEQQRTPQQSVRSKIADMLHPDPTKGLTR